MTSRRPTRSGMSTEEIANQLELLNERNSISDLEDSDEGWEEDDLEYSSYGDEGVSTDESDSDDDVSDHEYHSNSANVPQVEIPEGDQEDSELYQTAEAVMFPSRDNLFQTARTDVFQPASVDLFQTASDLPFLSPDQQITPVPSETDYISPVGSTFTVLEPSSSGLDSDLLALAASIGDSILDNSHDHMYFYIL